MLPAKRTRPPRPSESTAPWLAYRRRFGDQPPTAFWSCVRLNALRTASPLYARVGRLCDLLAAHQVEAARYPEVFHCSRRICSFGSKRSGTQRAGHLVCSSWSWATTCQPKAPDRVITEIRSREGRDGLVVLPKPRGLQCGDRVLLLPVPLPVALASTMVSWPHERISVLLAFLGAQTRVELAKWMCQCEDAKR